MVLPTGGRKPGIPGQSRNELTDRILGLGSTLEATIARVPSTDGEPGQAAIRGPLSPKFDDMETVIFDHVHERSADPATNRANIQDVLDKIKPSGTGKQVRMFIPPAFSDGEPDPIVVDRHGSSSWCIDVPSGTSIEGAGIGSMIRMDDDQPNFSRMLNVTARDHVSIRRLHLDGNATGNPEAYEHNHNIFVSRSDDVVIEDVTSVNATGDGVYIGGNLEEHSNRVWVHRCTIYGNLRNGITSSEANHVFITSCDVEGAPGGQAIDSEPDSDYEPIGLTIIGNVLSHEGHAVTAAKQRGMRVIGNHFLSGNIHITSAREIVIQGNTGAGGVYGQHRITNAVISDNRWAAEDPAGAIIYLESSANGDIASILVANNILAVTGTGGGITLRSPHGGSVVGNQINLDGSGSGVAVTANTRDVERVLVANNIIYNANKGIELSPGTHACKKVSVIGNIIDTTASYGVELWTVAAYEDLMIANNIIRTNASTMRVPNDTYYATGGTIGRGATWNCFGTPEGQIADRIGAMAVRRDGGESTTLYIKESGTGATGWRAV